MRIAVDASVLMEAESLRRLLLAADEGHFDAVWSPQVVGELAVAGLWRLGRRRQGSRSLTDQQYRRYREQLRQRMDEIELRFQIVRSAHTTPVDEELAWAETRDPQDLHVQLLARTARADCVLSWNHREFPRRQIVDGRPCGELGGVLWITPDQLPSLRVPALEVGS